jgi:hypothetical protein
MTSIASQLETIRPAPPTRLEFTSAPQTVTAGACSASASVRTVDPFGNPSPVAAATRVDLVAAPPDGLLFYSDACATAVGSTTIGAGGGTATFHFRGTRAGTPTLTASATGFTVASQAALVEPAAASRFQWAAIPTPQLGGRPFPAQILALDAYGNVATGFAGTAALSLSVSPALAPPPALTCASGCAPSTLTAGPFVLGAWSGSVSVSEPVSPTAGVPDRHLVATSGAITGASNAFELAWAPSRSPPIAVLTATPEVPLVGAPVTLDASGSFDYQTATADLEVAWDLDGAASGAPPGAGWSAWAKTPKTVSHAFTSAGTYTVRVAVRDADGDVAFASVTVVVRGSIADKLCVVDADEASLDVDDAPLTGATCGDPATHGPDGRLSLVEALRLAADGDTIAFAPSIRTIATGTPYAITKAVQLVAPGVVLDGSSITVGSKGVTTIVGLEVTGAGVQVTVPNGATAAFVGAWLHDLAGIVANGSVTLDGVRMAGCSGSCVVMGDSTGPDIVTVRYSDFRGQGSGSALDFTACAKMKPALDAQSNVFVGFGAAIRVACDGSTKVVHNTFDANGTGIAFVGASSGHVLRNNIFTNHPTAAAACGSATFAAASRDRHLLWQNGSDGCLAADPGTLAADPLYVFPASGDYRLLPASPAVDSAWDLSLNLIPAFPSPAPLQHLGNGPDRGGLESY